MHGFIKLAIPAVIAMGLSAVSVTAMSAEGKDKSSSKEWPSFRKVDADNNGAISQDEARNVSGLANFTQYDKNNDGQLSRSEYESAKKGKSAASKSDSSGSMGSSGSSGSPAGSTGAGGGAGGQAGSSGTSGSGSR